MQAVRRKETKSRISSKPKSPTTGAVLLIGLLAPHLRALLQPANTIEEVVVVVVDDGRLFSVFEAGGFVPTADKRQVLLHCAMMPHMGPSKGAYFNIMPSRGDGGRKSFGSSFPGMGRPGNHLKRDPHYDNPSILSTFDIPNINVRSLPLLTIVLHLVCQQPRSSTITKACRNRKLSKSKGRTYVSVMGKAGLAVWLLLVTSLAICCHCHTELTDDYAIVHTYPSGYIHAGNSRRNCTNDHAIIDKLLNGTGYSKFKLPNENGVDVNVEFWMEAANSIDEINNDFEMDMYINEMWLDPSLKFEHLSPCKENLSLSHLVLERLWTPNSNFINSKSATILESPFKNIFFMLYPNGTVWTNYRVRVKGPCNMDLTNFPMDIQTCLLVYESFNYNNQEVRMRWKTPAKATGKIVLPDYNLINISSWDQAVPYPAGMWDELHLELTFERRAVWYFMQAYLPTYFTVCISWVSFALGSKAIPARTMLLVNALLAIIFQFGNIMRNLPRVSYIKAIDVWMLSAMTFIFCNLIELAIVGYKVRDDGNVRRKPVICKRKLEDHIDTSPKGLCNYEKRFMFPVERCQLTWKPSPLSFKNITPDECDRFSAIAFPASFALFNIVYWSFYGKFKSYTNVGLPM
uniref:Neur_chan_LBD domain-containing protein n=1 Tax=Panagrellus redivivus TaxID=6233 RepID=A0A7E4UTZ8_PANRE